MTLEQERRIEHYLRWATRGLWGRERGTVQEELECHIRSRVAALCLAGMSEGEALETALGELGDARDVNEGMGKVYNLKTQVGIALLAALRQFRSRPLESLLIVVAVALGVGVVTAVAAFLDLGRQAEARFEATLASRELTLKEGFHYTPFPSGTEVRKVVVPPGKPFGVELEDLSLAKDAAPAVDYAYVYDRRLLAQAGQFLDEGIEVRAVTRDYLAAARVQLAEGSLPSANDFAEGRNVLALTPGDVQQLALSGDPIGQQIVFDGLIDSPEYTVIGVLSEDEEHSLVPFLSYGASILPGIPPEIDRLHFAVEDRASLEAAQAQLQAYATSRWGQEAEVERNERPGRITALQRSTSLVIAAFASIGLVAASLNIMNMMLARVFKRVRAIGVCRSLGASRTSIRNEYLAQALLSGLLGGLVGVTFGFGLLSAYNRLIRQAAGEFSLAFSPLALLIGLGLAAGVSVLFGIYPARLAAGVRPVDALREA